MTPCIGWPANPKCDYWRTWFHGCWHPLNHPGPHHCPCGATATPLQHRKERDLIGPTEPSGRREYIRTVRIAWDGTTKPKKTGRSAT